MRDEATTPSSFRLSPLSFIVVGAVFAAAYCQAPLYYSNQNQYFLHGLAHAGVGLLREDWLANTLDPTPVFSALVTGTVRFLHPAAFYLFYTLLLGTYAAALLGLFVTLNASPERQRRDRPVAGAPGLCGDPLAGASGWCGDHARRWPVFVALLLATHAALPRWCSYRLLGQDYPWFLQAGVAGQYVLGPVLQPSAFGVLLVVAVCLFARGRPFLAVVCVVAGAVFHSTYLLPAGLLTLGFVCALLAEGQLRQGLAAGALALVLALPVVIFVLVTFGPTSRATFAAAQDVLVNVRIPHHTQPELWIDPISAVQIGWMVLALVLVWRTRLFLALAVPFLLAVLLTLAQVAGHSNTLALVFPWRVSSVLMPVATALILARLTTLRFLPLDGLAARVVSAVVAVVLVAGGVWIMAGRQGFATSDAELPVMNFVRDHKKPGDVYLLRVQLPGLVKATRGSLATDFQPLSDKKRDPRVIPVGLQRFRLYTGAPIYVDFKSVPYKDGEVLEWKRRLDVAATLQQQLAEGNLADALPVLRDEKITHLVLPAAVKLEGPEVEEIHSDDSYRVYRLRR
jgi:uncharacterized protein DUF6798